MTKRLIFALCLLAAALPFVLGGCGSKDPSSVNPPTKAGDPGGRKTTNPETGDRG